MRDDRVRDGTRADRVETWHLHKGVSVAHLISTAFLLIALLGMWMQQDQRITRIEERQAAAEARADRYEVRIVTELQAIKAAQLRIEDRIERISRQ